MKSINFRDILVSGTRIETYDVQGVSVYVKRDDLCHTSPRLPNISKVRALVPILLDYKARGITKVAAYSTRVSQLGWATAGLCQYLGLKFTYYYPVIGQSNAPLLPVTLAKGMGASITALMVKDSTVSHYKEAEEIAEAAGETMLPYGLATWLAVDAYMAEAKTIPAQYTTGTVVGCAGSGTCLIGVWMAMPNRTQVIGVQVGAEQCWGMAAPCGKLHLKFVTSPYTYYNIGIVQPPFPSNRHYDAKAWEWLTENIKQLKQPVLFYNMGQ
jgi:1-aminocyclopropane-1-carboxylate deaminase/D-cysteine desulfhydrase-like pyridoxal-dependent ACC family enzyme